MVTDDTISSAQPPKDQKKDDHKPKKKEKKEEKKPRTSTEDKSKSGARSRSSTKSDKAHAPIVITAGSKVPDLTQTRITDTIKTTSDFPDDRGPLPTKKQKVLSRIYTILDYLVHKVKVEIVLFVYS